MTYVVKEIYPTLQGEGAQTGRFSVFCRFAGCNLWSGREQDRSTAVCTFCDTDFRGTDGPGGGRFEGPEALVDRIAEAWGPARGGRPYVVFTGGEPLLQLDVVLIEACHARGFEVGVETNGTRPAPPGIDWLCVSPKAGADLVQVSGQELKVVFPQPGLDPASLEHLPFTHRFLQPMDGEAQSQNIDLAISYCRSHPRWRLSLQTHKLVGLP